MSKPVTKKIMNIIKNRVFLKCKNMQTHYKNNVFLKVLQVAFANGKSIEQQSQLKPTIIKKTIDNSCKICARKSDATNMKNH